MQHIFNSLWARGALVALFTFFIAWAGVFDRINAQLYDAFLRLADRELGSSENPEIVLVAVSDEDVKQLKKPFPWPRDEQALIFEDIAKHEPSVVVVDLIYAEASNQSSDQELARQLDSCGRVTTAFYFDGHPEVRSGAPLLLEKSGDRMGADFSRWAHLNQTGAMVPVPDIATGIDRVGHVHPAIDQDGVIRKVQLIVSDGERIYPSLVLQGILLHWEVDWSQVRLTKSSLNIVDIPNRGNVRIPLDAKGRMRIAYPADLINALPGVEVIPLVQGNAPEMKGKMVFVGAMVTGAGDMHATPVLAKAPGVLINAIVAQTILDEDFVRTAGVLWQWLLVVAAVIVIIVIFRLAKPLQGALLSIAFLLLIWLLCFGLFRGLLIWISPVEATLAVSLGTIGFTLFHYSESEARRKHSVVTLSKFLGPRLAGLMANSPIAIDQSPRRKLVTVFLAEIVDFAALTEGLSPEDIVGMLNRYFDAMRELAYEHDGTVCKTNPERIMVFFNDPVEQLDHSERAVNMALDMQEAIVRFNAENQGQGLPPFVVHMGIATEYATVGQIGATGFSDYTVFGKAVVEADGVMYQTEGEIWVTARTAQITAASFLKEEIPNVGFRIRERVG